MRISSVVKGLGALLVASALVIGCAGLLTRFGRLDAVTGLSVSDLITGRDDGSFALGILTIVGWIAWGLLVASFAADAITMTSRRGRTVRLPVVNWLHPLTGVLVAAIVAMIQPPVAPASAAPGAPPPATRTQTPDSATPTVRSDVVHHVVEAGDDLWSLAQRYYGDGASWRRIADANQTLLLHGTDHLSVGMVLAIPDPHPPSRITVVDGDTLSELAETHLGDADLWPRIAAANPGLADADRLEVGMVLSLPERSPMSQVVEAGPTGVDDGRLPGAGDDSQPEGGQARVTQSGSTPTVAGATGARTEHAGSPAAPIDTCPVPGEPTATQSMLASVLPATLGASVVLGVVGAVGVRRSRQLMGRPVGRRLPVVGRDVAQEYARLSARAADQTTGPLAGAVVELGPGVERDLISDGLTVLAGPDGLDVDMANAIATDLATTLPDRNAQVICAGPGLGWLASLDEPLLETCAISDALRRVHVELDSRSTALADRRIDADDLPFLVVIVQTSDPMPAADRLAAHRIGVVQCVGTEACASQGRWVLIGDDEARHDDVPGLFQPTLLPPPARRVLNELFETVTATQYPPAPWWDGPELGQAVVPPLWNSTSHPMEVPPVPRSAAAHPLVSLLGPIELTGARGQTPSRATKQCIEYAAWILEHPGATSLTMANSLVVAETTRRSNMSRLRTWLGHDDNGDPYLPEAYSGRIMLHPAVTSDWEQLGIIVSGGVNRASSEALRQGLQLVRGAPLADAAPGQWVWAEQLRLDMIAMITDMAVLLAQRSLEIGDLDTARWAIERGAVANPDDESLLAVRLRLAARSGDQPQVDALVLQITRRARLLGVDLRPQTVAVLQEVVEGRRRASAVR